MTDVIIAADIYDDFADLASRHKQEWESRSSIDVIRDTLVAMGHDVSVWSKKTLTRDIARIINKKETVIFNLIEGYSSRNREAYVPTLAELYGIAHTGSDASAQIVSLDKYLTAVVAHNVNIPVKRKTIIRSVTELENLALPVFIKPRYEGSGLGIGSWSLLQKPEDKHAIRQLLDLYGDMVAEEYLCGDEFTVAVSGNFGNYKTAKPARIIYPGDSYGEEVKSKEHMPEQLLFDAAPVLASRLQQYSNLLCSAIGVSGYARVDWKLDESGDPFLLEINLTPGLSCFYSSFPLCYSHSFGSYQDMLQEIIENAQKDYQSRRFDYGKNEAI